MSLEDQNLEALKSLASEHNIDGRSSMDRQALIDALSEAGVDGGDGTQVSGFQQGQVYPEMPVTPSDFQALLKNPDLPAENQSAPAPEQLNPQLFT